MIAWFSTYPLVIGGQFEALEKLGRSSWLFLLNCTFNITLYLCFLCFCTGHGHCSTYTHVNCVQYGGFPRKIDAKNSRVNFYTSFYTQTFYTQIWVYSYGDWFCLQKYMQVACISLQQNVADVKLETDIVEKRLFAVKEKTTCYIPSLTTIMLLLRTSFFVINNFLGCWLKRYFTCKLGCMLLATTFVLK